MKKIIITFIAASISFRGACGPNGASQVADNPLNHIEQRPPDPEAYARWAEQQQEYAQALADAEQAKKQQVLQQEIETENKLNALKKAATDEESWASNDEAQIVILRKSFLDAKLKIPQDPWREIQNTKIYTMTSDSEFVKFSGQVLEVVSNGIRVRGNFKDTTNIEFFVLNFPYQVNEGTNVGISKINVALENGNFTYITTDGSAQIIPELNYGKVCLPPQNAQDIENKAKELTQQEQSQIEAAKLNAITQKNYALNADKIFEEFKKKVEEDKKAKILTENAPRNRALKFNQEQADKDDPTGLLRMAERYRDGEDVSKDLNLARQYFSKAIAAGSPTAADELSKLNQATVTINSEPKN